jgi:hypothetical protein
MVFKEKAGKYRSGGMEFKVDSFLETIFDLLIKLGWKCESDDDFTKLISPDSRGNMVLWLKSHLNESRREDTALFDIWVQTSYPGGIIREERAKERVREMVKLAEIRFQNISFEQDRAIWFTHKCYEAYFRDEESFLGEAYLFVQGLESFVSFVDLAWQETVRLTQGSNLETLRVLLSQGLRSKNYTHEILGDGSVSVRCSARNSPTELRLSISDLDLASHGGPDFTLLVASYFPGDTMSLEGKLQARRLLNQLGGHELKMDHSGIKIAFMHRFRPYAFSDPEVLSEEVNLLVSSIENLFLFSQRVWEQVFVFDPRVQEVRRLVLSRLNEWDSFSDQEDTEVMEAWVKSELCELTEVPVYLMTPPYLSIFLAWLAREFSTQKAC